MDMKVKPAVSKLANFPTVPVLVIMVLWFSFLFPGFLSVSSVQGLLRDSSVLIIAALGATFVFLVSGLDLSVGSAAACATIAAAIFTDNGGSLGFGVLLGVAVATFIGVTNGLLIGKLGLNPFVISLASLLAFRALAFVATAISSGGGGTAGTVPMPDIVTSVGRSTFLGVPVLFILAILMVVIAYVLLEFTTYGRSVRLVGQNEEAARFSGISVSNIKFFTYSLAGLFAGIAGIALSFRLGSGSPVLGDALLLQVITAVIIGGTAITGGNGGIFRTVWGAITIITVERGMALLGFKFYDNMIVLGIVILLGTLTHRLRLRGG